MKYQYRPGYTGTLRPYFIIALAGILAFAPVSFMLQSLKNDIVAIEYPINYFLSECIHNGETPYWFNTWGMGFPLHSSLTWGIYSTPQMLFSALFDYNIYILHIEFVFFVLLAGWGMFHLLNKYLLKDESFSLLLAICYMLSGFMVGSTQWLLYITAASFVPLVISSLLKVLKRPSFAAAAQFAVVYAMMFTSVYTAFNIITTYGLIVFLIIHLLRKQIDRKAFGFLLLGGILTLVLCGPCLYYTIELLQYLERGNSLSANTKFFNSNYVHPAALGNMLFPLSSVRMSFPNTEGTMLHSYAGLFVLLLLPLAIAQTIKTRIGRTSLLLVGSILFLLLSFGGLTFFRSAFNILPGFSYFRNPAIFRFYFILLLILFLADSLRDKSLKEIFNPGDKRFSRVIVGSLFLLAGMSAIVFLMNLGSISGLGGRSVTSLIKDVTLGETLLISAFIQLVTLVLLFTFIKTNRIKLATTLLVADIVVNTMLCTPFFSVSSYKPAEVNAILHSQKGFPVQTTSVGDAKTVFTDQKNNTWFNVNVFTKEVSVNDSYRGPLTLTSFVQLSEDSAKLYTLANKKLVFADNNSTGAIEVNLQKPTHVRATVDLPAATSITLLQNYYPGWRVYYNEKEIEQLKSDNAGITVQVPAGKGVIDFRFEKKFAWISALILHFIFVCFMAGKIFYTIKRKFQR